MSWSVRLAILNPTTRSLGREVKALLNSVQGGEDQTQSKTTPSGGSHVMMSAVTVALAFGSRSTEVTCQPNSSNARPMDPVPTNNSSRCIFCTRGFWVELVCRASSEAHSGRLRPPGTQRPDLLENHWRTNPVVRSSLNPLAMSTLLSVKGSWSSRPSKSVPWTSSPVSTSIM